jgi:hypothetical protein
LKTGKGRDRRWAALKPRAGSTRRTKLLDEVANMLIEMRRTMLGGGNRPS